MKDNLFEGHNAFESGKKVFFPLVWSSKTNNEKARGRAVADVLKTTQKNKQSDGILSEDIWVGVKKRGSGRDKEDERCVVHFVCSFVINQFGYFRLIYNPRDLPMSSHPELLPPPAKDAFRENLNSLNLRPIKTKAGFGSRPPSPSIYPPATATQPALNKRNYYHSGRSL
ncbi:hypothetical protein NPIL_140541 [Nephila pilipes]|uniref:Uncharacterized protein n=1 Tax=Nephila pilipes TaxID=299642 RepID=A0A8X6T842_NEPPI|nr:hypothetical protein NPIL_140541 [Nephila pilipes]